MAAAFPSRERGLVFDGIRARLEIPAD